MESNDMPKRFAAVCIAAAAFAIAFADDITVPSAEVEPGVVISIR